MKTCLNSENLRDVLRKVRCPLFPSRSEPSAAEDEREQNKDDGDPCECSVVGGEADDEKCHAEDEKCTGCFAFVEFHVVYFLVFISGYGLGFSKRSIEPLFRVASKKVKR